MATFNYSLTSFDYFIRTAQSGPSSDLIIVPPDSRDFIVNVYPRWVKHIAVEWTIPAEWGNCVFNVYFSQVSNASFKKVNTTPITGTYLIYDGTEEYRKFNNGFYIVEAIQLDFGNAAIQSNPTTWVTYQNDWVFLRAREVQRRESLLLTKFVGVKTHLFKRKTYGKRCPNCWNHTTHKVMKDFCEVCYGTSFEGGYFDSAPCYMQYSQESNAERRTYGGIEEPNQVEAWTISMPEIHPDDIIIRTGDWNIYRVEALNNTMLQVRTVRQIVRMVQLTKDAIENELVNRIPTDFPEEYL